MVTPDRLRSLPVASPPTILVFDSGLGGLTVLREIVRARPDAHYVYVADDAFFPYGHHREEEIIARVVPLIGELIAAHAPDLIVIACNTASTLGISHRHRGAGLHALPVADGPPHQARAVAGRLDRSGARNCPAGYGFAESPRQRGRPRRRGNDFYFKTAAHAKPGPDAVFRRPCSRVNTVHIDLFGLSPRC